MDLNLESGIDMHNFDDDSNIHCDIPVLAALPTHHRPVPSTSTPTRRRGKKFKDEESRKKWEDIMATKRKKLFTSIVKKEVGKQHRAKISRHKELLIQCKRVALQCQKAVRQKAVSVYYYVTVRSNPNDPSEEGRSYIVPSEGIFYKL